MNLKKNFALRGGHGPHAQRPLKFIFGILVSVLLIGSAAPVSASMVSVSGVADYGNEGAMGDAKTLYRGCKNTTAAESSTEFRGCTIPIDGTIVHAGFYCLQVGSAGSSETGSVYVRLNQSGTTLISSSMVHTAATNAMNFVENTGLSIAVVAGDQIDFKEVGPTFATNPTNVACSGYVIIDDGVGGGGGSLPDDAEGWLENDGAGTLSWSTPPSTLPSAAEGYLFNDGADALSWETIDGGGGTMETTCDTGGDYTSTIWTPCQPFGGLDVLAAIGLMLCVVIFFAVAFWPQKR